MKKNKKVLLVALIVIGVFGLTALLTQAGLFGRAEGVFHDYASKSARSEKTVPDKVAIILIDEASLQALNPVVGRWPWPRAIYSDLLEFLAMGRPKAVFFDILFTERSSSEKNPTSDSNDAQLASATANAGFVYHSMQILRDSEDEKNKTLLGRALPPDFIERFSTDISGMPKYGEPPDNNFYIPYKELYQSAKGMAVVEFKPDPDGIFRRTKPFREYRGKYFPVPGLAPFADGKKVEAVEGGLRIGGTTMPLDDEGRYFINVYGKYNEYSISGIFASLQKIRAGEVESLMVNPSEFKDKYVFIGSSAVGVEDLKTTAISTRTPGVFLHASLAGNFLTGDFLRPANRMLTLAVALALSLICVLGIFSAKKFWPKIAVPLGGAAGWAVFAGYGLRLNTVYEAIPPIASALLSGVMSLGYVAMTEGREKLKIRRMFSQYVSPEVLNIMMENPADFLSIGAGTKVEISILFSDIRNFTTFSEKSRPEQVVEMLNSHFSQMTDPIIKSRGTVDKFIGDAIMAFWGAPVKIENHADAAVNAALEMKRKMKLVNEEIKKKGIDFEVKIGVGINSGDAIIGNIGSSQKLNYTVIGDTINLGARLESITKTYGVVVIISEFTKNMLKGDVPCRVLDTVLVKGKAIPVKIFEPLDCHDDDSRKASERLAALTNSAFAKFEKGDYNSALKLYNAIEDGALKEMFKTRCQRALTGENS